MKKNGITITTFAELAAELKALEGRLTIEGQERDRAIGELRGTIRELVLCNQNMSSSIAELRHLQGRRTQELADKVAAAIRTDVLALRKELRGGFATLRNCPYLPPAKKERKPCRR